MANVFVSKTKKKAVPWRVIIPVVFSIVIIVAIVFGIRNVAVSSTQEQLKITEQAVRRSVVQCYAIEGRYPPSLNYLTENYGLIIDEEKYVYHYQRHGYNLLPDITVVAK